MVLLVVGARTEAVLEIHAEVLDGLARQLVADPGVHGAGGGERHRHGLGERIRLLESDGLAQLPHCYDLILCNPPYVNATSMAALPPEYRAEPELALAGGRDGMDFVRHLLRDAPGHMTPGAVLVLEIGNERKHFEAAFPHLEAVWLDTSAGGDQVLLLTREALSRAARHG